MTKPVTLSEEAFRVLRSLKRQGESDSDVVLRLAGRSEKDPYLFLKVKLQPAGRSWAEVDRRLSRMHRADVESFRRTTREHRRSR